MKIDYHDLYEEKFEDLVIAICQQILGIGTQGFTKGKDGGRDARFEGQADHFPSQSNPLRGKVIIQAKHTDAPVSKFSDGSFSGDGPSSVLTKELPRIKSLQQNGEIDHYILFSNRRLGGDANSKIVDRICQETGVNSVFLQGIDDIDRYIKYFPKIKDIVDISPVDSPLRVNPEDLSEVIIGLAKNRVAFRSPTPIFGQLERTSFKEKNQLNQLSQEYADEIIGKYLKDFGTIYSFLSHPDNEEHLSRYQDAYLEFNAEIIQHRRDYHMYDDLLNYLISQLTQRDVDLRKHKTLTRTMVYYMYWTCDLGQSKRAQTN